jgi:Dolichyl-phosphate-mannose-protein mannosyltransferase
MCWPPSASRYERVGVAALALLPLLPFLGAAVGIDAPVFLAVARRILVAPADPFGFEMIWDPLSARVAVFDHNPPLLSYYLAGWIALLGEREGVLHAALLPFPLLAALSFYGIARRSNRPGFGAAALLVATPAFLVLASSLLLEIPALATLLFSVYALLRARERPSSGWQLAAGLSAAACGLIKYVGCTSAPLLGAGLLLLPPRTPLARRARIGAGLRVVAVPVLLWALWGGYTAYRYGAVHCLGGRALVAARLFDPPYLVNHALSLGIYCGGALLFPLLTWFAAVCRTARGAWLAALGLALAGWAVEAGVAPGLPHRRALFSPDIALVAALCLASALWFLWHAVSWRRVWTTPMERFLVLWLAGMLLFSLVLNWHVSAADALWIAPPAILLGLRAPELRPSARALASGVAALLAASVLLTWADVAQRNVYRDVAPRIAREIGARSGQRWFVGHWGLQYYLEREGFRAVAAAQRAAHAGADGVAPGDWIVTARNVSQPDLSARLAPIHARSVWRWSRSLGLPLRVSNPDAGAGFYSHRTGYLPFVFATTPLDEIELGQVVAIRSDTTR